MKGLLLDSEGDLLIRNYALVIGEPDEQIMERVLMAYPGSFKEFPKIGAWIQQNLNGVISPFWVGDAKAMLRFAGVNVNKFEIDSNEVLVSIKNLSSV
jgi:hypothetical protein